MTILYHNLMNVTVNNIPVAINLLTVENWSIWRDQWPFRNKSM